MPAENYEQRLQALARTLTSDEKSSFTIQGGEADVSDSAKLCSQCSRIDFEGIFNSRISKADGYKIADLGFRTSTWNTSNCPSCRLFAAVRIPPSTPGLGGGSDYHLRAVSFLRTTREAFPNTPDKALVGFDTVCLMVLPTGGPPVTPERLKEALKQRETKGVLCRVDTSSRETLSTFGVRRVEPDFINFQLLRAWLDICQQTHYSSCSLNDSQPLVSLRLIDCQTRLIVEATSRLPFVALSYVWGSKPLRSSTHQPRSLQKGACIPDTLPIVIEDAITVTLKLGWRYLWVDRLCINQQDDADKHSQIGQMDLIFSGASVTLVAAAGLDADFGLPGVGSTPRVPQPFAIARNQLLASTMRLPEMSILHSKWATRGWTYQEATLSTRRLVFTEEQVCFECKCMSCCESVINPLILPINQSQENAEFRLQMRKRYFESCSLLEQKSNQSEVSQNGISQIRQHVQRFTARDLTYETDSLSAFLGILNQYRNRSPSIHHFWGLPINYPGIVQAPLALVINLCWQHPPGLNKDPPRRREASPSFSWAGWSGVALLPKWSPWAVERLATTNISQQPSPILSFLLEQVTKEVAGRPLPSYYLKMDVNMIKIQLEYNPTIDPDQSDFWFVNPPQQGDQSEYRVPAILSKRPFKGDGFFRKLQNCPCDCLVMAGNDSLFEDVMENNIKRGNSFWYLWNFLLLIEQHGDIYERIGVISDRDLALKTSHLPRTKRTVWLG